MKGYRTLIFNIIAMVIPILSLTEWYEVLPEAYLSYWMLFVAIANIILRAITTTPMGGNK